MDIVRTAKPAKKTENVAVWHCRGCGVVHLSIGDSTLNFPREEFRAFAESVVEAQYSFSAAEPLVPTLSEIKANMADTVH